MLPSLLAERANLAGSSDYNAHRQRCSRKIHKLRKYNNLVVRPTKRASPKPKLGTAEILAWQSQRAWAAAMELRSAAEAQAGSGLRRQSLAKLSKAAKFAAKAAEIGPSVDTLTLASLAAADYKAACDSWSIPREAYSQARLGLESFDDAVCRDYIQAHVDPALKLALSKTGGSELDTASFSRQHAAGTPLGALVGSQAERGESAPEHQVEAAREIEWRGHTAAIEDPDLAVLLAQARTADAALDPTNEAALDDVIQQWTTALDATRALLAGTAADHPLHIVATYAGFSLISRRIARDDLATAKPDLVSAVRLLDNILQSCTELAELPGVYADEALGESIDAMAAYFSSRRLALLARAYAQRDLDAQALALVHRAAALLDGPAIAVHDLPVTAHTVARWRQELALDLKRAHGSTLLASQSFKPVTANMAEFPAGKAGDVLGRIVERKMQLIPVKPVFYDLAFDYLEQAPAPAPAPSAAPASAQAPSAPAAPKKLFGIF